MKKNKIVVAIIAVLSIVAMPSFAGHGFHGGGHHHHSHSFWGHGGSHFWPGFIGGSIGGMLFGGSRTTYVTPAPVIVQQPVVTTPVVTTPVVTTPVVQTPVVTTPTVVQTTQKVWVPSQYVDQVKEDGTVVKVLVPGHYEERPVTLNYNFN